MPSQTPPTPRAVTPPEAKGAASRQETAALASGLERIRSTVLERLDQVEAALLERAARIPDAPHADSASDYPEFRRQEAELEQRTAELQQRAAELDEAQRRLRSERDRWENERNTLVDQLEHDRRLLTEAWERLEREKLEHPETAGAAARNGAAERTSPRVARPVVASDDENPVAQSILRQFQAVRRDVRRNANGPSNS